jgi:prepilin-type N-terminal cleavage/methylation domain-containing protein
MRKDGFTLIELMIVVAIIAIIAAIAIPNLLTSRMSANETNAAASLRTIVGCQATWRQQDSDGNGIQDFWVRDLSGLYRILRSDQVTMVQSIDISLARADNNPAAQATLIATVIGRNELDPAEWSVPAQAKAGYFFSVIANRWSGIPPALTSYLENDINRPTMATGRLTGNSFQYGYMAAPAVYATSGVRIFMVNEAGTIYALDPATAAVAGNTNKWSVGVAAGTGVPGHSALAAPGNTVWPGSVAAAVGDPTKVGHDAVVATVPHWAIVE